MALYDRIGLGYARARRPDPRIEAQVHAVLDDASTVANIGAGTGNYEPRDRLVIAVDPSATMLQQRPTGVGPAVQAVAESLPFADRSFDVAIATLTLHHWTDVPAGLAEMRRVARRQVILMNEPAVGRAFWLVDYFPEMLDLPSEREAPRIDDLRAHLDIASVATVPIPADCTDGTLGAYWARPEAYLDPGVRASMSPLARLAADVVERDAEALRDDLRSGAWDARYGQLRVQQQHDVGYRLIVAG